VWGTGKYGGALNFNGTSNMVRVPSASSLNVGAAMTLAAWIQPTAAQSGWKTIMQRETDAYFLNASNSAGPLFPSGGATFGTNTQWVSGNAASPLNSWTHVALTYDGTTVRLYVNGTQVATKAVTGAVQSSSSPLSIGGNAPYGEYFKGFIDEAQVYNRALTAAEVTTAMNTAIS
jgi:hypothetical protein